MSCSSCGGYCSSDKRSSGAIMGTCPDCRAGKYETCPNCRNWTLADGQDPSTCLVCIVRAKLDGRVVVATTTKPYIATIKVYKNECPCGVQYPQKCDYHSIEA